MKSVFFCPYCGKELIKGDGLKIYETLTEHVFCTNDELRAREYFICADQHLESHMFNHSNIFYSFDGYAFGLSSIDIESSDFRKNYKRMCDF